MEHSIIISGWHSGPNPSSGLGIAKSVKDAFPDMKIIALDYSSRSTGLYHSIVDQKIILPSWEDVDVKASIEEVADLVSSKDALFISGLDVEIHEVAKVIQHHVTNSFLLPPYSSLLMTEKPAAEIAKMLDLEIPVTVFHNDIELTSSKAESMGWPVLVKGSHYDAKYASNYSELISGIRYVESTWGDMPIVQKNIYGQEECISFCAYKGKLLGAVTMKKTEVTSQGKVWCGKIEKVDEVFLHRLSSTVATLNWTGGGEVETIWDSINQKRYLIDFNPRFPAWIYGGTVCGVNLPGRLVAEVLSKKPRPEKTSMVGFVRVIDELPADRLEKNIFLNTRVNPQVSLKGHPSGLSELSKKMAKQQKKQSSELPETDNDCCVALSKFFQDEYQIELPTRIYISNKVKTRLEQLKEMCINIRTEVGVEGKIFYSLKTNPNPLVLDDVLEAGCGIEAISLAEYLYAIRSGFHNDACILNGPGKWWGANSSSIVPEPSVIQCDSKYDITATLREISSRGWGNCKLGVRICPFYSNSRFGIDVSNPEDYLTLCKYLPQIACSHEVGIHFHYAESTIGMDEWLQEIEAISVFMQNISSVTGIRFTYFDFGGGWRSRSIKTYADMMTKAVTIVCHRNQSIRQVYFEPGKLIVEDSGIMVARIIGIRERGDERDIIIGAAINDVPDATSFPHSILWYSQKDQCWLKLGEGRDRVLGRICMESDIIRNDINLPHCISVGDYVAIKSVGAYDSSMAFSFGEGR